MSSDAREACPFCGAQFTRGLSACPECDLPLVGSGRQPASELFDGADLFDAIEPESPVRLPSVGMLEIDQPRPRPEYTSGELRCVVVAINIAEADMLEDMLRSEGIPCVVRRVGRADVPDFLAAGRREILVPEQALPAARDLLRIEPPTEQPSAASPLTLALAIIAGLAFAVLAFSLVLALN